MTDNENGKRFVELLLEHPEFEYKYDGNKSQRIMKFTGIPVDYADIQIGEMQLCMCLGFTLFIIISLLVSCIAIITIPEFSNIWLLLVLIFVILTIYIFCLLFNHLLCTYLSSQKKEYKRVLFDDHNGDIIIECIKLRQHNIFNRYYHSNDNPIPYNTYRYHAMDTPLIKFYEGKSCNLRYGDESKLKFMATNGVNFPVTSWMKCKYTKILCEL